MKLTVVFLLAGISYISANKKSYSGYQLIRAVPTNSGQVDALRSLEAKFFDIDFWIEPHVGRPCDMNVPPKLKDVVLGYLKIIGLTPKIVQSDVQILIEKNGATPKGKRPKMAYGMSDIVGTFPRHDEVEEWLYSLQEAYPELAKVEDIGKTYERRTQTMIKIGKEDPDGNDKPIIWLDSGIHAREWLTVGTTIWIINKMLTSYGTDAEITDLMDHYDWYILPIANPDGYEYTHTNDRLWRKTRSRNFGSRCRGTDPNRNWDFHWRESGTSIYPCSDTYGGPYAFSERCARNMRDAILAVAPRIKMYMGVHAYSQLWLTPWAYGGDKPSDYNDLLAVARKGNAALRSVHGTEFIVGTPPDILYAASGGAYDWAKGVAGIKYTYTYELRPDGEAENGFVVPESEIQPSGEEVWASLAQVAEDLKTE